LKFQIIYTFIVLYVMILGKLVQSVFHR